MVALSHTPYTEQEEAGPQFLGRNCFPDPTLFGAPPGFLPGTLEMCLVPLGQAGQGKGGGEREGGLGLPILMTSPLLP